MKSIRQLACLAVMAAIGFLNTSAPAHAGMKLTLTETDSVNGTNSATVLGDANGVAIFFGSLGVFNINVTTGVSKPALGDSTVAEMDLNSINVSTNGPSSGSTATLVIMLTDTDFGTTFGGLGYGTLTNEVGGTLSGGTATAQAWKDPGNNEFGMTGFTTGLQSLSAGAFSSTASVADNVTAPYSMTIQLTLTATGGQFNFSADDHLQNVVPELDPGSMASGLTLASGSLLMLFGRRRRACA